MVVRLNPFLGWDLVGKCLRIQVLGYTIPGVTLSAKQKLDFNGRTVYRVVTRTFRISVTEGHSTIGQRPPWVRLDVTYSSEGDN